MKNNVVPINSAGFPSLPVCDLIASALAEAERVTDAEAADKVTYVNGSTVRKLSPRRLLRRQVTLAIDHLDATRSLIDLYEAPTCAHGVSRRLSLGCVECSIA